MDKARTKISGRPFHSVLRSAYLAHKQKVRPKMAEMGLSTGQPKVLHCLVNSGGCIQRELAEYCDVEPATMSRLIEPMETQGLITRCGMENDRRCARIVATEKGERLSKEFERYCLEFEQEELKGFSNEEKAAFLSFLERMYDNIKGKM